MIIDSSKLEEQVNKNFRGGEKKCYMRVFQDKNNKIFFGRLIKNASIGMHTHQTNSETIYVTSGKGKVFFDDTSYTIEAGECHYCPQGSSHSILNENDEDLCFFAIIPEHKQT